MTEQLIVNCLHLSRREDREALALQQAKEQGYYLRFWEGIENRHNRKMGICQGHKMIIRDAKENDYPFCCIAEDDISWFGKNAWEYFLNSMPEEADIYFSFVYVGDLKDNRITSLFSGMSCYIVYKRFYDFFLSIPDDVHIDRHLGLTSNIHKYICCDQVPCEQIGGKSDNTLTVTPTYRPLLKGRKIFGDVNID